MVCNTHASAAPHADTGGTDPAAPAAEPGTVDLVHGVAAGWSHDAHARRPAGALRPADAGAGRGRAPAAAVGPSAQPASDAGADVRPLAAAAHTGPGALAAAL